MMTFGFKLAPAMLLYFFAGTALLHPQCHTQIAGHLFMIMVQQTTIPQIIPNAYTRSVRFTLRIA